MMIDPGNVRSAIQESMNTIMEPTKEYHPVTNVQMSRHNYECRELWCNALGREDQILMVECYYMSRDNKVCLPYKRVKELIEKPAKIRSTMGKGFVRTEADVYELLSLFMRYDMVAKDFNGKPDAA